MNQAEMNDIMSAAETLLGYRSGLTVRFDPPAHHAQVDRVVRLTLDNGESSWEVFAPETVWVETLSSVAKNGVGG